jgi:methionine synthase I (cobalamin-dependent)
MFKKRICFIDGAMGTAVQAYKLEEEGLPWRALQGAY